MSSELQLDVRHLNRWRRHLVNAYEVRQAWCLLQVKLCDPCLSAFKVVCIPCKALYKCSALPFTFTTNLITKWYVIFHTDFASVPKLYWAATLAASQGAPWPQGWEHFISYLLALTTAPWPQGWEHFISYLRYNTTTNHWVYHWFHPSLCQQQMLHSSSNHLKLTT